LIKDIECADLISTRYLSEIDEALLSVLNSCPSFAASALSVLHLSDALVMHVHRTTKFVSIDPTPSILVLQGLIFSFICDDIQRMIFFSYFLRMPKSCYLISCRIPNVHNIRQSTTKCTTLLPSVVFHIFSIIGQLIFLEYTVGQENLHEDLGYGSGGNRKE